MKRYLSLLLIAIFAVTVISGAGVVTTNKVAASTPPYEVFPTLYVKDSGGATLGSLGTSTSNLVIDVVKTTAATYYFKPTTYRPSIEVAFCAQIVGTTTTQTTVKTFFTDSNGWAKDANGDPIGFVSGYLPSNVVTAIQNPSSYTVTWYLQDLAY
jgi:hypothetical protein